MKGHKKLTDIIGLLIQERRESLHNFLYKPVLNTEGKTEYQVLELCQSFEDRSKVLEIRQNGEISIHLFAEHADRHPAFQHMLSVLAQEMNEDNIVVLPPPAKKEEVL